MLNQFSLELEGRIGGISNIIANDAVILRHGRQQINEILLVG